MALLVAGSWAPGALPAPSGGDSDADLHRALALIDRAVQARIEALLCLDVWSPREFLDAMASSTACEVVVEEGDSTFGTVHVIGQLHEVPDTLLRSEREALARYQAAVFRRLLEQDARVVFVEGWPADSAMPRPAPEMEALLRETVRDLPGPEDLLDRATDRQMALLQNSHAVQAAFLALRHGAQVLGADTLIDREPADFFEGDSLTFDVRERVAMSSVTRYLSRHRGSRVFLVYGSAHVFDRASLPPGSRIPRITMTSFPGLAARHPRMQAQVVRLLGGDEALLDRFVRLLDEVSPEAFALLPERVQRTSLEKPFCLARDVRTGDALEKWLVDHARSPEIRGRLKSGGFRYFEE